MAGNEKKVIEYLFDNLGIIKLKHLGKIDRIGNPTKNKEIINVDNYEALKDIKTEAAQKKADIYLNDCGVSIKQSGGCFLYNRLQREGIISILDKFDIDSKNIFDNFDKEIVSYHNGEKEDRNIKWDTYFSEEQFKILLKYLMMDGSPYKVSEFPAQYILEAPKKIKNNEEISVFTFDEFFEKYRDKIVFSIRRQWIGQKSKSENNRALALSKKILNKPWVFDNIVGTPSAWQDEIPEKDRKTVYFLMIEKLK